MAKRAAARAANSSAAVAAESSVVSSELDEALASIAGACEQLSPEAVVHCPVRVLMTLCDAADGDAAAAPALASVRGVCVHAPRESYRNAFVSELREIRAAIERKAAPETAPAEAPPSVPETGAATDPAAA